TRGAARLKIMNCERCKNELEDFIYGELGEALAVEVRSHLAHCAACATLRNELERENEIFGRFYEQTSIEPAAEMWEAIRARISGEAREQARIEGGPGWLERLRGGAIGRLLAPATLRQAAFAALLVVLSVAATTIYLKLGERGPKEFARKGRIPSTPTPLRQVATPPHSDSTDIAGKPNDSALTPKGPKPPSNRATPPRPLTDQELMNRQIARAEREYQKAVRLLDQAIARQRDRLDPALIKQYESSLALIDDSINASRRAFRERPDDPIAGQFLLAAYAKKLDLMQDIAMK
ncbi:MAG TPA: zf-HC2 domain-containing protein, partial [Blastocatellia bacterium]|nr:zf-HC2 domain-containing protein [Blastocatellia bacterium]